MLRFAAAAAAAASRQAGRLQQQQQQLQLQLQLQLRRPAKYGHSNFSLEILEYCAPSDRFARENHFLASLKPEYNIAKDAQAPFFNRLHTPETKAKMSEAQAGRNHTPETRGLMSILKTGENNPSVPGSARKRSLPPPPEGGGRLFILFLIFLETPPPRR